MINTNSDIDQLLVDKLVNVTETIKNIYDKLCELEINNKKDSDEYKKNMKYLNMVLELEEELYINLKLSFSKCAKVYHYLLKERKLCLLRRNNESIVKSDYEDLCIRRIISKLANVALSNIKKDTKIAPFEDFFLMQTEVKNSSKDSIQIVYVRSLINRDLYMGYSLFLEDIINDEKKETIRGNLIRSKYYTSFIIPDLEMYMLLNKFNSQDKHILSSEESSTIIFKIPMAKYNIAKSNTLGPVVKSQTIASLAIKNSLFSNSKYETESKLRNAMLKSALSQYTKIKIEEFEAEFNDGKHEYDALTSISYGNIMNVINEFKTTNKVLKLKIKV